MKVSELREKTSEELGKEVVELTRELFNLRMQRGSGQLANPSAFGKARKDIARIKTILSERGREQQQ